MKTYQFVVNNYLIGEESSIREKQEIISILIGCIKYIISAPINELRNHKNGDVLLTLYIDKMSRIFITRKQSISTFQFPFNVYEVNGTIQVKYKDFILDNKATSVLLSILNGDSQCYECYESMFDIYQEVMQDFDIIEYERSYIYWDLIVFLMLFEPGYLRYDYDEDRQNGRRHPLNHLDVYYSGKSTFKLGLLEQIDSQKLIDILDIGTDCKFVS